MLNSSSKSPEGEQDDTNGHAPRVPERDAATLLADMERQIKELKQKLSMARGTEDIVPPTPVDTISKIEHTLRTQICTTEELAKAINEPLAKVQEKLKSIRKHLADIGTPDQARWVWRIGDETPASELRELVARLIEGHAMTTAELAKITGARMPRVNGVIVDLQRDPEVPIFNLGSKFRAKWLILPKTAQPANLPPKTVKK